VEGPRLELYARRDPFQREKSPSTSPNPQSVVIAVSLGVLAVVALLLAAVGIYGVTAYTVGRRVHEIGVRMALGARATAVFAAVIGQGLRLSLLGAGLGLAGALGLSRVLGSLLHEVSPTDPWTFAAVASLLVGVSALASFLPARRAAGVDPLVALREY
jgi:putative ABC transport system permease protein